MEHFQTGSASDSTLRFVFADRVISFSAPSDLTLGEIACALGDIVPGHCGIPLAIDLTMAAAPPSARSWWFLPNKADTLSPITPAKSFPAADLALSRRELFRNSAWLRGGLQWSDLELAGQAHMAAHGLARD